MYFQRWEKSLAENAAKWVSKCDCSKKPWYKKMNVTQNVEFATSVKFESFLRDALFHWYNEKENYDEKKGKCKENCDHYTTVRLRLRIQNSKQEFFCLSGLLFWCLACPGKLWRHRLIRYPAVQAGLPTRHLTTESYYRPSWRNATRRANLNPSRIASLRRLLNDRWCNGISCKWGVLSDTAVPWKPRSVPMRVQSIWPVNTIQCWLNLLCYDNNNNNNYDCYIIIDIIL